MIMMMTTKFVMTAVFGAALALSGGAMAKDGGGSHGSPAGQAMVPKSGALAAPVAKTANPGQTKSAGEKSEGAEAAEPAEVAETHGKTTAPGQAKGHPDNLGNTVSGDCAKATAAGSKDDCVKKAQSAAGTGTGAATAKKN